jgi:methylglutaconyl-CoA hydratase
MTANNTLSIGKRAPGVAQITMSRPEVFNAFDEAMIGELDGAFDQLIADDSVRVILLAGDGKHFSAGADLKWMQRASEESRDWNLADARRFAAMLGKIDSCPKPTLARIQGAALGGGVGLACACDVAIAADNASFAVSEAKFGILPAVIGPYLTNAVGKRHARWLALTMTRIRATEAGAPGAQREIKALFSQLEVGPVNDEVRELTAQTISRVRGGEEAREGFAAFLDKRPPKWIPQ